MSTIIRSLSNHEINDLNREILINDRLWIQHPMEKTYLDIGKTLVINWVTKINNEYQIQWTMKELFPDTWKFVTQLAENKSIGKVYWHRLKPLEQARPHTDNGNPYMSDKKIFKRLNIFLDIPTDVSVFLDGEREIPIDNKSYEFTLVDLSHEKLHSVVNNSNKNVYIMVIDILKEGTEIYTDLYKSLWSMNDIERARIIN